MVGFGVVGAYEPRIRESMPPISARVVGDDYGAGLMFPGDTIFAIGALVLGWFVLGLRTGWSLGRRR